MTAASRPELTLLGRPECSLCERFLEALAEAVPDWLPQVRVADVDARPGWTGRWGLRIPVLLDDEGSLICEAQFDAVQFAVWWHARQR